MHRWKAQAKGGAPALLALDVDLTTVIFDDSVGNGEAQPHTLAHFFGGKKRFENLVFDFRVDADTGVGYGYHHLVFFGIAFNDDGSLEIAPLDGENKISSMTISVKKGETLVSSRTFTDMDSKTYNFTNEDVSAFTSMENELGENSSATFTFEVTGTANFEVSTKVKIVFDSTVKASLL